MSAYLINSVQASELHPAAAVSIRLPKPRTVVYVLLIIGLLLAVGLVIVQDQETLRVRAPLDAEDSCFPDYLARLVGRPVTSGDAYGVLRNGNEAFPAMLRAIEKAKHWRDTQFEVRGPAVDNIEAGFHENWIETGESRIKNQECAQRCPDRCDSPDP